MVRTNENCKNYAHLCKTIYATEPILFRSLRLKLTKVHVKFHLDPISSFVEEAVQMDREKNGRTDKEK